MGSLAVEMLLQLSDPDRRSCSPALHVDLRRSDITHNPNVQDAAFRLAHNGVEGAETRRGSLKPFNRYQRHATQRLATLLASEMIGSAAGTTGFPFGKRRRGFAIPTLSSP